MSMLFFAEQKSVCNQYCPECIAVKKLRTDEVEAMKNSHVQAFVLEELDRLANRLGESINSFLSC